MKWRGILYRWIGAVSMPITFVIITHLTNLWVALTCCVVWALLIAWPEEPDEPR